MPHATLLLRLVPALAALASVPSTPAGAISGVCPDGSIFIVQQAEDIPCRAAKRVEPGDIPPLNPEFLPRPYGWEVFNRESDPNNPYNVIDSVRPDLVPPSAPTRAAAPPAPTQAFAPPATTPTPGPQPGGRPSTSTPVASGVAAAPPSTPAPPVALSPGEIDDLAAIVEVLQERAPATFVQPEDGKHGLRMRLARSAAFESRVGKALAARGTPAVGPVVAFHVQAEAPGAFWGNLTFVQDHLAYHPDPADPTQLGVVDGRLGPIRAGERVLGYAVLPPSADMSQPLDVYWNDRRLTATLNP